MTPRIAAAAALLLAVLWGGWVRIETALADPSFDAEDARGMLRSDPALLYYLTERIVESGGAMPDDFHAETRIQHPHVTDVPAEFPLGLEFLVAWGQRFLGGDAPLHLTALRVMAFSAALFVLGVYLSVFALTRKTLWALLAAVLALVTPANYRTIGFLLVGEDLSLPLFALHLGWLALAVRSGRRRDFLGAGFMAAAALATWHAMSFVLTLELALLWLGACWRARSPFLGTQAGWVLAAPLGAGVAVPVLRASGLCFSPAAALVGSLVVLALAARRGVLSPWRARALLGATLLAGLLLLGFLAPDGYAHVHHVVLAKLRFLGRFPDDPNLLSFDARLLWQGPFATLPPAALLAWSGWPLALLFAGGLVASLRLPGTRDMERFFFGFVFLALGTAWMFERLVVLVGLLAPCAAALAFSRIPRRTPALAVFGLLLAVQAGGFARYLGEHRNAWLAARPAQAELVALIEEVRRLVPPDEPIAGDFVTSTAILAHTRNPIVLQPKYETDRSRRQAEAFLGTFFHGSVEELATLLRERFECRHLLVARHVLWDLSRVTAGLRADQRAPEAGTAAAVFLSQEQELPAIPGFELLYRSPPGIPGADYRLYRLP